MIGNYDTKQKKITTILIKGTFYINNFVFAIPVVFAIHINIYIDD